MFDPRDHAARLREALRGQGMPDTAEPFDPAQTPMNVPGAENETGYPPVPYRNPSLRRYEYYFNGALAATTNWTNKDVGSIVDRMPDYWAVSNGNITNTELNCYMADSIEGYPIRLGPGGFFLLPWRDLAHGWLIRNVGSGTAKVGLWLLSDDSVIEFFNVIPG